MKKRDKLTFTLALLALVCFFASIYIVTYREWIINIGSGLIGATLVNLVITYEKC